MTDSIKSGKSGKSVRSEGAKHGLDNLDMLLSKLDTQSVYGWPPPPPFAHSPGEATPNPGFSLQKLPHYPAYLSYPGSSAASSRSLLSAYHQKKRCGTSSCACRVAVVIIIILLFVWGVTIPLYFFVGPGRADLLRAAQNEIAAPGVAVAQMSSALSSHRPVGANPIMSSYQDHLLKNNTVLSAVNCSVRIVNQLYTPDLDDLNSVHFHNLKLKMETLLSLIFQREIMFEKIIVLSFSPDTVVHFVVTMKKERKDIRELIHNLITSYLLDHFLMLGVFQLDISTLKVEYIEDPCVINNGGCSHRCFWSLLNPQRICQCPHQYYLKGDDRTCQFPKRREAKDPVTQCTESEFLCASNGNCIPKTWVCDGVSDCLWSEDEESCENNLTPGKISSPMNVIQDVAHDFINKNEEQQVESLYNMFNSVSDFEDYIANQDDEMASPLGYPVSNDVLLGQMNKLQAVYEQMYQKRNGKFKDNKEKSGKDIFIDDNSSVIKYNDADRENEQKEIVLWDTAKSI